MFFLTLQRGCDIIVPSKGGKRMSCWDCSYCWQGEEDDFPCCHCHEFDVAPCEYEDVEWYEEDEELG